MVKSWTDKLHAADEPKLRPSPRTFSDIVEGDVMLVPTARQVDEFMRAIPAGTSMDVRTLRRQLALKHGAEATCPLYTGYHLRTVAEAAHEALEQGARLDEITPFWRVLDEATPTTGRLTFGAGFVHQQRREEGLPD
jgi:hypothetical protein